MTDRQPIETPVGIYTPETVLKRDVFSETSKGHLSGPGGGDAALRDLSKVPWYARILSQWLARREARALREVQGIEGTPVLLHHDRNGLLRRWSDGAPLQLARPSEAAFYRDARRLLREMRRRGVTHNDLAKPQNWLQRPDGRAAVIDFQLASVTRRRGRLFRIKGYEDLRHLMKMKRKYAPQLLTPKQARIADTRSVPSRIWRATGKRLYNFVTRRLMHWSDNEGAGNRLADMRAALQTFDATPGIRGHALFSYPLSGSGIGLYLFVETGLSAEEIAPMIPPPGVELVQTVTALPRHPDGRPRHDLLELIANNRLDEMEAALAAEPELADTLRPIIAGRRNLTDRIL